MGVNFGECHVLTTHSPECHVLTTHSLTSYFIGETSDVVCCAAAPLLQNARQTNIHQHIHVGMLLIDLRHLMRLYKISKEFPTSQENVMSSLGRAIFRVGRFGVEFHPDIIGEAKRPVFGSCLLLVGEV